MSEVERRRAGPAAASGKDVVDGDRGRDADDPTEIPAKGWKEVLVRTRSEIKDDRAPLLAAAVAFYALLALVPALVAVISLYGLLADPSTVDRQVSDWLGTAPREVRDLLRAQLTSITENAGAAAGVSVVIGIVAALWSASSGMAHLVEATNIAYDEQETRGFVKRRSLAVLLTLGAIAFVLFAVGFMTVLPAVVANAGMGLGGRIFVGVARWVVLLIGMMFGLAVLYRYAPDRADPRWSWTSPGAIVGTLLWLAVSAAFTVYTSNFGKYNETYGSLGAVVVVMLWLFLTALCVIVGAELNAESERQTRCDTTDDETASFDGRRDVNADRAGEVAEAGSRR